MAAQSAGFTHPGGNRERARAARRVAWDHRITTGPGYDGYPWRLGENRFYCLRHADGSECVGGNVNCYAKPTCRKCGAIDRFRRVQEAYGDRVTCLACEDENWYSIED